MKHIRSALLVLAALTFASPMAEAGEITLIDFESLFDGDNVTTQFAGVTFWNTMVATARISLNEFEFPPYSGVNAAYDAGGAITIDFASAIMSFDAYFTYAVPVTIQAFDASSVLVGSATAGYGANFVSSGNPPNELIHVAATGIRRVLVTGDSGGGSFAMDDLTYESEGGVSVPDPGSTMLLLGIGLAGLSAWRRQLG